MIDDIQNSTDTASVFDDLGGQEAKSEAQQISSAPSDQPGERQPEVLLNNDINAVSDYIKDLETLVIAKVLHKIHIAYYRAWTSDLRGARSLISRLNRRRNEIIAKKQGKLPTHLQTG
jgi:hypothetical protein